MKPLDLLPRYFDPQPKRLSLIQRVGRILGKKTSRRSWSTPTFDNEDGFMAQRTYEEILAELDHVSTAIALTDPEDPGFDRLCARQEELIRLMNGHTEQRMKS